MHTHTDNEREKGRGREKERERKASFALPLKESSPDLLNLATEDSLCGFSLSINLTLLEGDFVKELKKKSYIHII